MSRSLPFLLHKLVLAVFRYFQGSISTLNVKDVTYRSLCICTVFLTCLTGLSDEKKIVRIIYSWFFCLFFFSPQNIEKQFFPTLFSVQYSRFSRNASWCFMKRWHHQNRNHVYRIISSQIFENYANWSDNNFEFSFRGRLKFMIELKQL